MFLVLSQKKKKYFQEQKLSGLNTILFLAVMLVEKYIILPIVTIRIKTLNLSFKL